MSDNATATMPELVITRTFDAPRDLVWKALSTSEALGQWWGPKGFDINVAKFEFRPDGVFHYSMLPPGGDAIWGKFVYKEIEEPHKIVFVNSFSDAEGNITPNPWLPKWPLEVHNTLTLEEQDGKTVITIRGGPINATPEQLELFASMHQSMQEGFKGTWEKLDTYLAKEQGK